MFFNFKPKPILSELLPHQYIDIHSHILPGLDDGSKSITDSKILLEAVLKMGFKKLITTPHTMTAIWNNSPETINSACKTLCTALPKLAQALNIQAASEYLIDNHFIKLIKEQKLLTLKDTYVLVELSYLNPPFGLHEALFELQTAGYTPVLAHPERYRFYHNNFNQYHDLKKAGCLFQLNLLSTVGYYGKSVAQCANKLLKEGLIDFTGSDIHHKKHIDAFQKPLIISEIKALENAMKNNRVFG